MPLGYVGVHTEGKSVNSLPMTLMVTNFAAGLVYTRKLFTVKKFGMRRTLGVLNSRRSCLATPIYTTVCVGSSQLISVLLLTC